LTTATDRSTSAADVIYQLDNYLTGECLSTNYTYKVYTTPCSEAQGQKWAYDGFMFRNTLTQKCLSTNMSGAVYTATCNIDAPGQFWMKFYTVLFPYGMLKNQLTDYERCLSTNYSSTAYTVLCNEAADGQFWRFPLHS